MWNISKDNCNQKRPQQRGRFLFFIKFVRTGQRLCTLVEKMRGPVYWPRICLCKIHTSPQHIEMRQGYPDGLNLRTGGNQALSGIVALVLREVLDKALR